MGPRARCWDAKLTRTLATELLARHLGGAPDSAWGVLGRLPRGGDKCFEKWVDVQDEEEFPSVYAQMGFGDFCQLEDSVNVDGTLSAKG